MFCTSFSGKLQIVTGSSMIKPFYIRDLESSSVEHRECFSNCSEIFRITKVSGGINILKMSGYWFPTGFSVNETLSFYKKCQNQSSVRYLGN